MTKGELIKEAKQDLLKGNNCQFGICYLISNTISDIDKPASKIYPELKDNDIIQKYGGYNIKFIGYYWEDGVWNTGRLDFFNMLYDKYKDDNTEI